MALQTLLALVSLDPSARILTVKDSTGVYSVNNPGGIGAPNPSSFSKLIFEVGRLNSSAVHSVEQNAAGSNTDLPSIAEVFNGDNIILNSKVLGITTSLQGLEAFSDGVLEVKYSAVVDASVNITGLQDQNFIIGVGLDAYTSYEAVSIGGKIYKIDHGIDTNGGTVLYLQSNLEANASTFSPVKVYTLKVLVNQGAASFLSGNIGNMAKVDASCGPALSRIQELSKIYMWYVAATAAFNKQDYLKADRLLQGIADYGGCTC